MPQAALQTIAQAVLEQLMLPPQIEEEIMLTIDIPYVPVQDVPVLVAQVTSGQGIESSYMRQTGSEETFDGHCADVGSLDAYKGSSFNVYSPIPSVFERLGYRWDKQKMDYNAPLSILNGIKASVFEAPQHGTLALTYPHTWSYVAEAGYEGRDQVIYLVEVAGKHFKVVVNLLVHQVVDENANPPECEKIFKKGVSPNEINFFWDPNMTAARSSFGLSPLRSLVSAIDGVTLSSENLLGTALAQTTGEGSDATITLDDNAANHGWYAARSRTARSRRVRSIVMA